jgi:IS605 OrfB family transposase
MRDAVNKAARLVVNHCLNHGIGTVVFGWNQRQKDGANMGCKTNQMFVQIPTAKLKNRIAQLCETHGILFVEQEESYTSQASALDLDVIPVLA